MLETSGDDASAGCARRRAALDGQLVTGRVMSADDDETLWFVTVTLSGEAVEPDLVRAALERLALERPFLVSARYAQDRAEVRYWDECDDAAVATAQALRLWTDHEVSAGLPEWRVVGLEVHDRETVHLQRDRSAGPRVEVLGEVRPFDAV